MSLSLLACRGGIGATLGAIGAQLPYPYVHLVYWTIQVVLVALSIETGVTLAANTYFARNGRQELRGLCFLCFCCFRCFRCFVFVAMHSVVLNSTLQCAILQCFCMISPAISLMFFFPVVHHLAGAGDYSPVDDTPNVWPQYPEVWYFNTFMQITVRLL
jgi:hypothetical protein